MFTDKGLPSSLYTDRGSHYFHTPEAGGKVAKDQHTQVGRALHQLGIEHIAAYSPEARGRSERAFGTLQDRLVKELALAGIATVEAANRFIADTYLPDHNRRFTTPPELEDSAFVPLEHPGQIDDIVCPAQIARDNTVRYERRVLQIPATPARHHYVKATVRVHEYPDGTLALFHGPRPSPATTPTASPSKPQPGRPRETLRRDRPAPCGQVDSRAAPDHFPTGQTATTEADK